MFFFIFQSGCKKDDLLTADNNKESLDIRSFFSENKAMPDQVVRVMEELKIRGENSRLVGDISKRYGSVLWEKSMVKNPGKDRGGTPSILKNQKERNDTLVIIPLLKNKSNQIYAYIEANLTDKVELRIRTAKEYSKKEFGKGEKRVGDAEKHALRLMLIYKEVFGYKEFEILDKRLFMGSYGYNDSAERKMKIVLKDKENTFNKLFYNEICLDWIILDCTRGNARKMKTDDLKRDAFIICKEIGWDYECYGYWDDDGEDDGNPDPCDGGRIMERLPPCDERGEIPGWEPVVRVIYTTNYQMTQHEKNVFDQLDAEDNQANQNHNNLDCSGTKRTGNIYFQGTKEHWLIQLDYVSKNPLFGNAEFAIPHSSAAGNRGYADIVNTLNGNIFEIKPNNAQGISQGVTEVNNYVTKANVFCNSTLPQGIAWNKGSVYEKTVIPTSIPNNYLQSELVAPGVIGYRNVSSTIPIPSPVLIPTSILNKFKYLIDRLKYNFQSADRIIAEFLKQNPELLTYIKNAAIGAGIAIIVGTIIEDVITAGVGIADDWACFVLAYRIIRFGIAL